MKPLNLSRRDWLRYSLAGASLASTSGWFDVFAQEAAPRRDRKRACILMWMSGGPSQMDTFDLKPGTPNGGLFKDIATAADGMRISEHLPKLAQYGKKLAVIRSMTTKEGDHSRGASYAHCGYLSQGPIKYPTLGSLLSKELGSDDADLPNFISISPARGISPQSYAPGFLGARYAPLLVGDGGAGGEEGLTVEDLRPSGTLAAETVDDRLDLLTGINDRFLGEYDGGPAASYRAAYDRAVKLMKSEASKAFSLDDEPAAIRDAYGRNRFGQGCLMARRLIERGVPFVEVAFGGLDQQALGWDTHADNFTQVRKFSEALDAGWSALMHDLEQQGRLDDVLIVWMGEFGRTPKINPTGGRDHYPQAWSVVLAGGGIKGGQVIGRTSADGTDVED
ncbi:MAG TPA: DUF1501 domain-containing protein, partial [Planctomycetaceae bacterium]|nr:DUF1501 domain-containing protein [Planctomycetaceae bacterium]